MKFRSQALAESARDRAFESAGNSLMIVKMEGHFLVTNRREAIQLEKKGYKVY